MARIPRLLLRGESATYHVVSRSALPGFPLGDVEKDFLLALLRRLSRVYFAEVLGFCLMGNHAHLVVRMHTGEDLDDDEIRRRYRLARGRESIPELFGGQIPFFREKWGSLSEFVKDWKQTFSRWYNRSNGRSGFFWGERFKSVLVEDGDTLVNLLAYVDLNPVRARIVERPEDYRWSSLGYHLQTGNQKGFLSLDLGLRSFADVDDAERLRLYRRFVYEIGSVPTPKGTAIPEQTIQAEERRDFQITALDRFRCRTRHFTDSGVIGTKHFVAECYRRFEDHFACRHPKKPHPLAGVDGVFTLKRLRKTT
jgi:REP element-mobilizing transposase RayT